MSDRPTNRADALLILRGLACLAVAIAHCQPPLATLATLPWGWLAAMPGGIAVRIFFTLSGYLMGKGFYLGRYGPSGAKLWRYFRSRAARILPLYWAAVFVPALLLAPSIFLPVAANDWVLLRYLTFTYNHTLPEPFNPPLWSLSTEVQFYLAAPLLFWLLRDRLQQLRSIVLAIIGVALGWLVLRETIVLVLFHVHGDRGEAFNLDFVRYVYTFFPANLDAFLCGLLLNPLLLKLSDQVQSLRQQTSLKGFAIAGIISLLMQCAHWKLAKSDLILSIGSTLAIAAVCLFIVAFELGEPYFSFRNNRTWSIAACRDNLWRCWEAWGILSYGIYVWHYPLTIWLLPKFGELTDLGAFFQRTIAVVGLATLAAIVTNLAIERPGAKLLQPRR